MKKFLKRVSLSSLNLSPGRAAVSPTTIPPSTSPAAVTTATASAPSHKTLSLPGAWNQEGYLLRHLGMMALQEGYSDNELLGAMRDRPKDSSEAQSVHLQLTSGVVTVTDLTGQILIEVDIGKMVMCVQDVQTKEVQDCIGIVFSVSEEEHHLHTFQAMSFREASTIVQHLGHALHREACSSEKKTNSQSSGGSSTQESPQKGRSQQQPQPTAVPTATGGGGGSKKRHHSAAEMGVSSLTTPTAHVVRTYGQSSSQQVVADRNQREPSLATTSVKMRHPGAKQLSSSSPSASSSSKPFYRHSIATFSPGQKKRVTVKRVGSIGRETTLSAEECILRVSRGADRVRDSNKKLVLQCKNADYSEPLGEAMRAIFQNDLEVLGRLLNSELLAIESGDEEGNTLLHMAVACQRSEVVKLLCERGACVDAAGVGAARPLHRAGAEGCVSVVHSLLERGASPNDLDSNLRSPLHFTAAVKDHLECSYALLERGARIYQEDALGVRPFDLNNPLKEMQSSLVTSVCETFQTTHLADYEVPDLSEDSLATFSSPTGTPNVSQLFPWGSRDRSLSSGSSSHGHAHMPVPNLVRSDSQPSLASEVQYGSMVSLLPSKSGSLRLSRSGSTGSLDQLSKLVRLANKRARRLNVKLKMKHSQLFSNEVFLEAEEDEMQRELRKEKLKFPSDFGIDVAAAQVGITAENMEQNLNQLIRFAILEGQRVQRKKEEERKARVNLVETEAALDVNFGLLRSGHQPPTRSSSAGRSSGDEPRGGRDQESGSHKGSGSHTSSDTLVNTGREPDVSDTGSVMTTSSQAMSRAFSDLQRAIEYDKYHSQIKALASGNSEENIPMISIAKHPLHHVPRYRSSKKDTLRKRPEPDSVFDEIMADLQGDLPALEGSKPQQQQQQQLEQQQQQQQQKNGTTKDADNSKSGSLRRTLGPPVDIDAMSVNTRRRSSSALVTNGDGRGAVPVASVHPRSMSFTSSGSSTALIYPHHHRRSSSQPFSMAPNEPGAASLRSLIMLSSNEECLARLVQYVALPQFSTRLVTLARSARSSCGMLANIATLLQNIYEVGGPEGRKKAVESGILGLTVKLLRAGDPIPGTMLQVLYSLLFSEEDPTNYLRAIAKIPIAPLLSFLEPEDRDSGFENRQRDASLSSPHSGSLDRSRSSTRVLPQELPALDHKTASNRSREDSDGSSDHRTVDHHGIPLRPAHHSSREANTSTSGIETHSSRTDSFRSDPAAMATTDSGGSSRSLTTPTLHGQSMTLSEARRIALKLFAALSVYDRLHKELGDARVITLLVENLSDFSQENITNAVITLSNIAKNPNTHPMMVQSGVMDKLTGLLSSGPTIRHHAAKTLVYLGEMNTGGITVFKRSNGYGTEEIMYNEGKEHDQIWGATLEHLVNQLIEDPTALWNKADMMTSRMGGFPHLQPPTGREITRFFLVTMSSFVDPLIFLRLLLHRITSDESFLSLEGVDGGREEDFGPGADVLRVLAIMEQWMQDCLDGHCSDDFVAHPILGKEVANLIQLLKQTKGYYSGAARSLKKLLDNMGKPHSVSFLSVNTGRVPHHDHLYPVCQRMVVEGLLPVTLEQVVMLGGLQLHIESLQEEEAAGGTRRKLKKRSSSSHLLKKALPMTYQKHKSISKRLLEEKAKYSTLSERNSKHLYIEKCQSIPGYNYQFFEVTLKSSQISSGGTFFRKPQSERRLLGISDKQLILLDERTKHVLSQFSLKDVVKVTRNDRPHGSVTVRLRDTQFHFVVEDERRRKEMLVLLEHCEDHHWNQVYKEIAAQDDLDDFDTGWPNQLLHISPDSHHHDDHLSTQPPNSSSRPKRDLLSDLLRPAALGRDLGPNAGVGSGDSHVASGDSHVPGGDPPTMGIRNGYDSDEDGEGEIQFQCDCPEDPELGSDFNMADIDLGSLLRYPLELSRQLTLIDHELLCSVSSADILQKIRMAPKQVAMETRPLSPMAKFGSSSTLEQTEGTIEKLAFRFNQIGNWVASSVLFFDIPEERAEAIALFIEASKFCFEMRNYSGVMAIVVHGLGSPSIRRLKLSWERVSERHKDFLKKMNNLLDSKLNYSKYREMLSNTSLPAVPYFGVFLKDLTQIVENNPDYLKGGLVNLVKRKQIYRTLNDMMSFKRQKYNFLPVHPVKEYLRTVSIVPEGTLHELSHKKEPKSLHATSSSLRQSSFLSSRGSLSSLSSFSMQFFRRLRHASTDSIAMGQ